MDTSINKEHDKKDESEVDKMLMMLKGDDKVEEKNKPSFSAKIIYNINVIKHVIKGDTNI